MSSDAIQYTISLIVSVFYAAMGSALFYSRWGRKKLKVYLLSDLLDVFQLSEKARVIIEFVIFVGFGCAVSIGIVHPQNAAQAFSAGLGWTGLAARPK